jgi:hypothetical protein
MGRRMIVGRQMIVGRRRFASAGDADYSELMGYATGADPSGGGGASPQPYGVPVAYVRSDSGPSVVDEQPTHTREFPIGFTSVTPIAALTTPGIEVKPQVLFRGERLAVPNSIVLNFAVSDIKVGKDSQLAAPGSMPSECFSNISVGVRMQLDTAEPGITITLFMNNTDPNNAHNFSSVLYGTVIE